MGPGLGACLITLCPALLQRDLESINDALRIPGNKSLGPVARVSSAYRLQQDTGACQLAALEQLLEQHKGGLC
jgi:hypothetical protein